PRLAARHSWSTANDATATCRLAGRSSPFNPLPSRVPCAANPGSTGRARSSSVAPTNSSLASSVPEAGDVRPVEPVPKKGDYGFNFFCLFDLGSTSYYWLFRTWGQEWLMIMELWYVSSRQTASCIGQLSVHVAAIKLTLSMMSPG